MDVAAKRLAKVLIPNEKERGRDEKRRRDAEYAIMQHGRTYDENNSYD